MSTIIKSVDNGKILKIVSISEALKQALINYGFNGSRIIVAHDGFDPEKFHEIIDTKDARIALKLPLDSKIITYTGSLYKDRKIENIIRLAERFQDALFVVVGGPNDQCEYYRRVAQSRGLKNVHLTGQVKHSTVPFYLQASDILLALWSSEVPTINYCSPLKIFEYMASGKLILAHGFETIKEVLSDGVNAVIVEPDSFEDLCDKLDYILTNDDLQHLGDNARKIAFEKYSWDIRCGYIFKNIY
jgi:glycosyltransferase involved in cell wall biosynthesis